MASYLQRILEDVEDGLPNDRGIGFPGRPETRLSRAEKARQFYNFDGHMHIQEFLNDAETAADYIRRPYRESGLTRMITDILCEHLYSPGPLRQWDDSTADALLHKVYDENHVNALMQRAENLSTLMDVAAIQVDAGSGEFDDRPISLYLWGADEFVTWPEPDDRLTPFAICTIDKYDLQTRFRVYTADRIYTFLTAKAQGTSGGRTASLQGTEANPYGRIPFAFIHYTLPVNDFWEPGIGDFIVQGEVHVNNGLSRLAQAIYKHLNPIPIVHDAPDNFQIILGQPNLFIRLNRKASAPGVDGAFGNAPPAPSMEYLQAHIDIQGAWDDLQRYVDQLLESTRVPRSAVRMEQTGIASGIALIVEQAPLLTRAQRRQPTFGIYEECLARLILGCAGAYYRRPGLLEQARKGRLTLRWPTPTIPVQTDDWLNLQLMREQAGLTSKIMITMETFQLSSREQAIAHLEQVAEDRAVEAAILRLEAAEPPEEEEADVREAVEGEEEGADDSDETPVGGADEGDEEADEVAVP